jgi:anhydro-N-acetylmuramic acid kinase
VIVAGVMSGTSADGINVALVRISSGATKTKTRKPRETEFPRFELLGHAEYAYPQSIRRAVLASMNATRASVADLARLNFLLGELYADAVLSAQKKFRHRAELVGCHGQTLYHQGNPEPYLARRVSVTWQMGEGAVIAARVGVPVVSDFRPADMAVGGKGAPLVPYLDYVFFRSPHIGRILQNLGGIGNLTAIPAGAKPTDVVAFDTGPGNMVIDAVVERLYQKAYDAGGRIAYQGKVLDQTLSSLLRAAYFSHKPPKTAGREEFGREFVTNFLERCRGARKQDVVATATALTTKSIAHAVRRFVLRDRGNFKEIIVSGGGANNTTLLAMLRNEVSKFNLQVRLSDEFGLPGEAKEAVAFAILAFQTWHRKPSNIPSATGAKRPAILGKISYA